MFRAFVMASAFIAACYVHIGIPDIMPTFLPSYVVSEWVRFPKGCIFACFQID